MTESNYWLDLAVAEIVKKYPKGEVVLSSGISPSASYHVGHFREILTVEALTWGLHQAGRKARHVHVVDNFDPLRRRYSFLPESFEQYVGTPVCLIPDPEGDCHKTYADHFYSEFEDNIHKLGIQPEVVKSYEDLYKPGKMSERFEEVLGHLKDIHKIFAEVSNRKLETNWTPIQVLGEDNKFFNATADTWDKPAKTIAGQSYANGHAKLNWRLDWPARWKTLGVMVEPFGRELASAGSAYHTGVEFAKQVFNTTAPLPVAQYEPIHLVGESKKMSSSLGNLITPEEAFKIMPPEIWRYFVVRSRPDKKIHFDPGVGMFNLIDEYSKVKSTVKAGKNAEFKEAYQFASAINESDEVVSDVPYNHLVSTYQASRGEPKQVEEMLKRSGFGGSDFKVVEKQLPYVKNWLAKYAPENVKFEVQAKLPKVELSKQQNQFLSGLAEAIAEQKPANGQKMHELIYEAKDKNHLQPGEAFQAIYRVILGKNSGPKAGLFLASLDQKWLVERLLQKK